MSSKLLYLAEPHITRWLSSLTGEYSVFAPFKTETTGDDEAEPDYAFRKLSDPSDHHFSPYRPLDPLKSFFTPYIEKVAGYFDEGEDVKADATPTVLFGVKACDLAAHRVQDYVFLEGVEEDPFYRARRDNVILVSGDCPAFKDVCFCLAMNGTPYPTSDFDLNLSPCDDGGLLVECGTERGQELINKAADCFVAASEEQAARREESRREVVGRLREHLHPQELPASEELQGLVKAGMDKDTWERFAETCVECGGCNLICDTCHCFLLSDKKAGSANKKVRLWDSCQYKNFATVAGGANPMRTRGERLRNRFLKKFDFFVENMQQAACCGCGRCIEVCPGEIDIRDVLKDLRKND